MAKRALICGVSGQDGSFLAELLLGKEYEVWGGSRDAESGTFNNLHARDIYSSVKLVSLNPRDLGGILSLIRKIRPHEIYNLAGQTSVSLSFDQPVETIESVSLGTLNLLEAIRLSDLDIRFYNAGSTEIFGDTGIRSANEDSSLQPCSPYGVAKASAYWTVQNYRKAYGMYACTGILSNHESPLRPKRFVTRKIIHSAACISLGMETKLKLGNLDIERDWGWAPDYVTAIAAMMQQPTPTDYIIATGKSCTLVDFVRTSFELIKRDWRECVILDDALKRPADIACSRLCPAKASAEMNWRAKYFMSDVVNMMLDAEIRLIQKECRT